MPETLRLVGSKGNQWKQSQFQSSSAHDCLRAESDCVSTGVEIAMKGEKNEKKKKTRKEKKTNVSEPREINDAKLWREFKSRIWRSGRSEA